MTSKCTDPALTVHPNRTLVLTIPDSPAQRSDFPAVAYARKNTPVLPIVSASSLHNRTFVHHTLKTLSVGVV